MNNSRSYVILQEYEGCQVLNSTPPLMIGGMIWTLDESCSLGGFFYDYIRDTADQVMGVRYWIGSQGLSVQDTAFLNFLEDERFLFSKDNIFVDILFDSRFIEPFKNGDLIVDNAQDFGGEFVLKSEKGTCGIGFSYEFE
jgi:hypothetical protein